MPQLQRPMFPSALTLIAEDMASQPEDGNAVGPLRHKEPTLLTGAQPHAFLYATKNSRFCI
jgi:hypothetical protein